MLIDAIDGGGLTIMVRSSIDVGAFIVAMVSIDYNGMESISDEY